MVISVEKNELYIISKLVDGCKIEELIFFKDYLSQMKMTCELQDFMDKNCVQAVAYLHGLVPPEIHQDIKPATVLVSRQSAGQNCAI